MIYPIMVGVIAGQPSVRTASVPLPPAVNVVPNTPTITAGDPDDTTCALSGSAFSDPDGGDTHLATQWQVTLTADTTFASAVFDSETDAVNLLTRTATGLTAETGYISRCRYQDNHSDWSNYSSTDAFTTDATPANTNPNTPTITVDSYGGQNAYLTSTAFSDDDVGDTHAYSQWQVTTSSDTTYANPVFDSGEDASNLVSIFVSPLVQLTDYICRVRHEDNNAGWSAWSANDSFTTTAVEPGIWFEENWDYADLAELQSDPNGWVQEEGNGVTSLDTGLATPYGTNQKAPKCTYLSSAGGEQSAGIVFSFPDAEANQPGEIWCENYLKYETHFKTDFSGVGNPDHKTNQWFPKQPINVDRWGLKFGSNINYNMRVSATAYWFLHLDPGSTAYWDDFTDMENEVWDGNWHRIQTHLKYGTNAGDGYTNYDSVFQVKFDDVLIASDTQCKAYWPSNGYPWYVAWYISRTMNQVPDVNQSIWIGRARVWITNPGWDFSIP